MTTVSWTTPSNSEMEHAKDSPTHSLFFQHRLAIIIPVRILNEKNLVMYRSRKTEIVQISVPTIFSIIKSLVTNQCLLQQTNRIADLMMDLQERCKTSLVTLL